MTNEDLLDKSEYDAFKEVYVSDKVSSDEWAEDYWKNAGDILSKEFSQEAWKEWGLGLLKDTLKALDKVGKNFLNGIKEKALDFFVNGAPTSSDKDWDNIPKYFAKDTKNKWKDNQSGKGGISQAIESLMESMRAIDSNGSSSEQRVFRIPLHEVGNWEGGEDREKGSSLFANPFKDKNEAKTLNMNDYAGSVVGLILINASFEKTMDFNVNFGKDDNFLKQLSLSLRGVSFGNKMKYKATSTSVGGKEVTYASPNQESGDRKGELTIYERPDMRFFKWSIKKIGLSNNNLDLVKNETPFDMTLYRPTIGDTKGIESYKFEKVRLYEINGLEGNNSKDLVKYSVKFIYRNVTKTTN